MDRLWRMMAMTSGTKINNTVTENIQIFNHTDSTVEKLGKPYISMVQLWTKWN